MRSFCLAVGCGLCISMIFASGVSAHTLYKRPFQKRYDFRTVSCYACHVDAKDENGKRVGKEELNDLGKVIKGNMGDGTVTERINEAKKEERDVQKKLEAEIAEEFLKAMDEIDKLKSPDGETTWGELIKAGKIDGVKMKKPK